MLSELLTAIFPQDPIFVDPQYQNQWHLKNSRYPGNDCNVTGVWSFNITGKGVVVAVVDDGKAFRTLFI